jgi:hypothetical protein
MQSTEKIRKWMKGILIVSFKRLILYAIHRKDKKTDERNINSFVAASTSSKVVATRGLLAFFVFGLLFVIWVIDVYLSLELVFFTFVIAHLSSLQRCFGCIGMQ